MVFFTVRAQSGCEGLIFRLGIEAHIVMGLWSEFKLKKQADMVPRDGGSQNVCNVIYQKMYLIRLIIVSCLRWRASRDQPASMWWISLPIWKFLDFSFKFNVFLAPWEMLVVACLKHRLHIKESIMTPCMTLGPFWALTIMGVNAMDKSSSKNLSLAKLCCEGPNV